MTAQNGNASVKTVGLPIRLGTINKIEFVIFCHTRVDDGKPIKALELTSRPEYSWPHIQGLGITLDMLKTLFLAEQQRCERIAEYTRPQKWDLAGIMQDPGKPFCVILKSKGDTVRDNITTLLSDLRLA